MYSFFWGVHLWALVDGRALIYCVRRLKDLNNILYLSPISSKARPIFEKAVRCNRNGRHIIFDIAVLDSWRQFQAILGLMGRHFPLNFTCSKTTKETKICSKLTIKTPERRHWHRSGVYILNIEHNSYLWLWKVDGGWISWWII